MTGLQVEYFLKVADCMSFSQAAQELYVSQPSVSRQIRLLEEELGHKLFDRSRKNAISLTAAGMVFRDAFHRSRRGFEEARTAAQEVSQGEALSLRVGIGQCWDLTEELLAFREEVRLRYPRAKIHWENNTFLQLRSQVAGGQLDVALCTKTSVQVAEHLEMVEVGNFETLIYVRRGLLRQEEESLRLEDFNGHTLLMLPEEEAPMSLQIIQLQLLNKQVHTHYRRLPNRDSIYQSLLMGEGFAVFDEHMWFGTDPRLTHYRLEESIPVCVVWHRRNQNPLIRLFAEVMSQQLQK